MKQFLKLRAFLAASALLLTAGQTDAGSIARLVYDGNSGTAVATLTNAAIFPDQPTFREPLDDFSPTAAGILVKGLQGKENTGNNFDSYIRGYLEAPASGDYIFFIASDDASELWLSTDHIAANRKRIAFESSAGAPLFSGARLSERRSAPITLTRGQKYYLEILHKQSTGTSYVRAGWQRPDGVQEIIPARHLAQHPLDPYLGRGEPNLPPTFNTSGLNGGDLPATVSAKEGDDVVLELDVIAAQPTTIEWRRNGAVIPGENLSFFKVSRVSAAASGQTIQAVISNAYGRLTSASARLSITADTTPPAVVSVDHRGNPNQLRVTFTEPVAAATNLANFELKPATGIAIPIQSAVLLADGKTVQLSGSFNFVLGGPYKLTVRNIDDQAATPNRLSPNPSNAAFTFAGDFIGPVGFAPNSPLQNLSVVENRTAHFEVLLAGAKPWLYQWNRNGTNITGATNSILDVIANAATAGSFRVSVSNEFSTATSPSVQLTVLPDTAPPKLVAIRGLAGINAVRLTFDEAVTAASATNTANYSLGAVPVLGATLGADGRTVTLLTGPLQAGQIYLVSIIGLKDRSIAGNFLRATASFAAEVDYAGEVLADSPVRYWRFNETGGNSVASLVSSLDTLSGAAGTLENSPASGVASLVPSAPEDTAIQLTASSNQRIAVPNGADINTGGPWAKRAYEVWFRAASAPAPDATGLAATVGIWEEGAGARNIALYLWRDPAKPNPNEAELVFHAFDNAQDGPGAPFGLTTLPAVFVPYTVKVGQTYHVVAVFDGDATGLNGNLILYVNGAEVGRVGGVGQIYAHGGDVQIGRGNGGIHTGENGNLGFFDGVLDDLSTYNHTLARERVTAHYQAGIGGAPSNSTPPAVLRVDTRGDPNQVLVTFSKPVAAATATNLANFTLKISSGTIVPIQAATLLTGELTVQLAGAFNFQTGGNYELTVKEIADQASPPNKLAPNPASVPFSFTENGSVGIAASSDLASRTVVENQAIRFLVVPTGTPPFSYQWFRNGVALPGETKPELLVTATSATVGEYTVKVGNEFSEITSPPARLTLQTDSTPPRLTAIRALAGSINEVRLTFDELLDVESATNRATYDLGALPLLSAQLSTNGLEVTLRTGPQQSGHNYTLTIAGLKDRAAAGNALNITVPFVPTVSYVDEILADGPVRYWRFNETAGTNVATLLALKDTLPSARGALVNGPTLGIPGLVPNLPDDTSIRITASNSNYIAVPNGADLNITAGPWAKRTFSLWFKAASLPRGGASPQAPVFWEEGGDNRGASIYLYGTQDAGSPNEALLVWNIYNNAADGASGGWGVVLGKPENAVFVTAPVQANRVYHVVAVFDGDPLGTNGEILLYLNGQLAGTKGGAGQLFNHSANIQIGRGAFARHDGVTAGNLHYFDGVLDELAIYNQALSAERVAQLYQIGLTPATTPAQPPFIQIRFQGGNVILTWEGPGKLERADSLRGPFSEVPGAASPYAEKVGAAPARFFRLAR